MPDATQEVVNHGSNVAPLTRRPWRIIVGAVVLLATFIVKDTLREHLRAKLDSMNSAEVVFLTRNDVGATNETEKDLETSMLSLESNVTSLRLILSQGNVNDIADTSIKSRSAMESTILGKEVANLFSSFHTDALLAENSGNDQFTLPLSKMKEAVDDVDRKYHDFYQETRDLGKASVPITNHAVAALAEFNEVTEKFVGLHGQACDLSGQLHLLGSQIFVETDRRRRKVEIYHDIVNLTSIAIGGLGLGLVLYGMFYQNPAK